MAYKQPRPSTRADPNGRVGIARGDGTMLLALGGGIVRTAYEGSLWYSGWRPVGVRATYVEPSVDSRIRTPTIDDPDAPLTPP